MSKFRVGQRVRLIKSLKGKYVGLEATITSGLHSSPIANLGFEVQHNLYSLDIEGKGPISPQGHTWAAPESWLAPVYDGWDKISWDECIWRPKELVKG